MRPTHSGLRVNAGHGLNYENVPAVLVVPHLVELNIGHSLVSRAITVGLVAAVREMLACMASSPAETRSHPGHKPDTNPTVT